MSQNSCLGSHQTIHSQSGSVSPSQTTTQEDPDEIIQLVAFFLFCINIVKDFAIYHFGFFIDKTFRQKIFKNF